MKNIEFNCYTKTNNASYWSIDLLPTIYITHNKEYFIETGVTTKATIIGFSFLLWDAYIVIT